MKGTKGMKRTLSMLTACTLSVAMLGLMPVSAQEAPALESNVSAQAQMPEAFDATQDALELLEQTIATLSSPELQQCERQDLCSTFGVSDLSELTYSAPYYWYNFYSQERVEGEGMTYVILVYRDGAYCGYLHVTPAYGLIQKVAGTNTGIETALENHAEMWFGSATVDGLPCHLLYADGVIYNYDRDVATDLVWGDIPYSEYNSGMVIEKPGTTTEPTADESVQLLGDVDLDGRLTLIDVVYLSKAANDSLVLNDAQRQNADCNADGELNAQDAVSLLRFLVHTADSLPN